MVYLRSGIQLIQELSLLLIVPCRHDQRNKILCAKALLDHLVHHHRIALHRGFKLRVPIDIRAVGLDKIRAHQHDDKQRRNDKSCLVGKFTDKRNVGDKALVLCLIHRLAKEHNESRHQQKYRKKAQHNRPYETQRHIAADAKLHEHHRDQAAHRGERAGRDLRNRLAERHDVRLADAECLVLLFVAVTENHGIVHRQG